MAQQGEAGSKKRPKFFDVLEQLSGSDSESNSSSEAEEEEVAPAPESKKPKITFADLEQKGYKSGPSVVYMKAPQQQQEQNWNWSSGREKKAEEDSEEDVEERERTRHAVTGGVEASAEYAQKAVAYAAKLRDDAFAEKQRLAAEKRLSFNQKEKKKRDKGQVSRSTNYVEEEKRLARQYKQYSGFD